LTYISSEGYSEADFRHGPIAIVQSGYPIMLIAPNGAMLQGMHDLLDKLKEKSAECLVVSNDKQLESLGQQFLPIPDVPEWLSPIVSVVPGQIFAMQQALVRGYEVDRPRGLSKVTVTK
jgi:glucosamine--fructose-6-phosphate aminotransferase (isomerizing)